MKRKYRYYRIVWLRHDFPAGLAVFLVALPLCLGVALASGAPLYSGLLSGIIGGLVVSLLSGSRLAVSGPAAGLTTLVSTSIVSLGGFDVFLLAVIVAGLFQVTLGTLRLGAIANYFPSPVIKGMLAAIGIILVSKQIPLALGYDQPDFWTSGFVKLFSSSNFLGNLRQFNGNITRGAIWISIISLAVMVLLKRGYLKPLGFLPAPLLVVVLGIGLNHLFAYWGGKMALSPGQLVNIPQNVFASITFPDFSKLFSSYDLWKDGLVIGVLASLETLLCIEAMDKLDKRNLITPVNRELVAQGIGNMLCGLLGAIPITAVVVRGAANIEAGGRTKMASFSHGALLLLAVVFIPFVLNQIPYASLAVILLATGYSLTRPKLYRYMWRLGWNQFLPFLITIVVILLTDLLVGVGVGLLISIYFIIQHNFKAEYKVIKAREMGIDHFIVKLNTNVTFLNKVNLRKTLDEIPEYSVLTIDGTACNFIDHDILETISEYHDKAGHRHIELHLKGIERVEIVSGH